MFLAPRRTLACDKIFEDEGIMGEITIREFPLYMIPLEPDLLSLELDGAFEELYLVRLDLIRTSTVQSNLPNYKKSEKILPRFSTPQRLS